MWLAPEERRWLQDTMDAEDAAKAARGQPQLHGRAQGPPGTDLRALYFGLVMGIYGLSLWLPSIVKAMGTNLSNTLVGFIVPIPYICRRRLRLLLEPALRPHG